jgi:hypothetical protein
MEQPHKGLGHKLVVACQQVPEHGRRPGHKSQCVRLRVVRSGVRSPLDLLGDPGPSDPASSVLPLNLGVGAGEFSECVGYLEALAASVRAEDFSGNEALPVWHEVQSVLATRPVATLPGLAVGGRTLLPQALEVSKHPQRRCRQRLVARVARCPSHLALQCRARPGGERSGQRLCRDTRPGHGRRAERPGTRTTHTHRPLARWEHRTRSRPESPRPPGQIGTASSER